MPIIPIATMDEIRETYPSASLCGSSITYDGDGKMFDQSGHRVEIAHTKWMDRALRLLAVVSHEHRINPEGLIPTCAGCGQSWPCAIARVLEAE